MPTGQQSNCKRTACYIHHLRYSFSLPFQYSMYARYNFQMSETEYAVTLNVFSQLGDVEDKDAVRVEFVAIIFRVWLKVSINFKLFRHHVVPTSSRILLSGHNLTSGGHDRLICQRAAMPIDTFSTVYSNSLFFAYFAIRQDSKISP